MKGRINLDDLHKVEASVLLPRAHNPADIVDAIIKVSEANYIPKDFSIRAEIGAGILTGQFPYGSLSSLERDPKVMSVSISKKFKSVG